MTRREALKLGLAGGAAGLLLTVPLIGAVADGAGPAGGTPAAAVGTPAAGESDLQRRIRLKLGEIDEIKEWHSLQDQIVFQASVTKNMDEARRLCAEQEALTEKLVAALRMRGDAYWILVAANWDLVGDGERAKKFVVQMVAKSQTPTPLESGFIRKWAPELAPTK
jgi:hypothetical protein